MKYILLTLQRNEIVRCHRVGRMPSEPGRPRPVLVKFQCERRRDTILRQRGNLKKSDTISNCIFINEDHTATRALLVYQARKLLTRGQ